jgi:DNA topoisomerase-3
MVFTSVTGHLMGLEFDASYSGWQTVDPIALFEAPVHRAVSQDKLPLKQTLEQESRRANWLVLWLDGDREV